MLTAAERATVVPREPPSVPRLLLAPVRSASAVLDGGWWPRSWDPTAELPGLVLTLSGRYGRIRNLVLNSGAWSSRFRRLVVGTGVVRVGWFHSIDIALLVATTERGDQIDLLVVPPTTAATTAENAMRAAADPADKHHASHVLAAAIAATEGGEDPAAPGTGTVPTGAARRPSDAGR
ncbi:DUF5994 family protein [Micromonospora sp. NPDC049559]|uniref:DUF5994 family protein n=1 Tax=Micromonospora sp. NPDC049559 TaxID=3155923 RepID=UPI0034437109